MYQTIREFTLGARVYGHFMITSADCRPDSKQKEFLDLRLVDQTGDMGAKRFECLPAEKDIALKQAIIYATGTVTDYKGSTYLKIEHMERAPISMQPRDFVKTAPFESPDMLMEIHDFANRIENDKIRRIVTWCLMRDEAKLLTYPASKSNHHAIYGGLLFHILTMLQVANLLLPKYSFLNPDLLFAGIILHDLEKLEEMDAELGIMNGFTPSGELLGHIVQGVLRIEQAAVALEINDPELIMILQHIILSHHGQASWGSPQEPAIPEALMLHMIDNIDAKMYGIKSAFDNIKEGSKFTEPIKMLSNRRYYKFQG